METVLNIEGAQRLFKINEPSDVAVARRAGVDLAASIGFSEVLSGQLAIVITEAATNIVKHAQQGEVLLRIIQRQQDSAGGELSVLGIEVLAVDAGPGIADLDFQMQDGHSTVGTYGVGLGSIQRLSHYMSVYSQSGSGTVLLAILWSREGSADNTEWEVGLVCLPLPSEQECGDAAYVDDSNGTLIAMVADGLGHGPEAALASGAAVEALRSSSAAGGLAKVTPQMMLQQIHLAMQRTRGAAIAIAQISRATSQLTFAGVGNIAGCVITEQRRNHLISHNGIVGSNIRKIHEFALEWPYQALLILHSDGLSTKWDMNAYQGLVNAHPALIAAVLYRDFYRGRDDVTVLVVRQHT
jgi:anti-sigma regulatory factor (Ser/Thr protein kinase)/serine/threonine protein phosphatase PrpC